MPQNLDERIRATERDLDSLQHTMLTSMVEPIQTDQLLLTVMLNQLAILRHLKDMSCRE